MQKTLLITRPRHDDTTHYLFNWSMEVISFAKDRAGIEVLDIKKERVNKKDVSSIINKKQPSLVFFNGHGSADFITGHNNEVLIRANDNEFLLKGKIVYALSCKSAIKLGPKSIAAGALAYIGYKDDFIFCYEEEKISRPLDDQKAQKFLEPSNYLVKSLIKGRTSGESHIRSKNLYLKNIQEIITRDLDKSSLIPFLLWNMQNQVCLGNPDIKF